MDTYAHWERYLNGILAFGPIATMLAAAAMLGATEARSMAIAVIILWAPTPIGIPSLLTQNEGPLLRSLLNGTSTRALWAVSGWVGAVPLLISL